MDPLQIVRDAFPISGGRGQLQLAEGELPEPDRLTIRLVIWEEYQGELHVRDIKEQQVYVGGLSEVDPERLEQAVAGWRMALGQLFAQTDITWLGCLMPMDLVPRFAELALLRRPRSAEDFAEALLASKHRFGRWLRP